MDHPCRFNDDQQSSVTNDEFYNKLGYITSLYNYLKFNFTNSQFLLYRNLSFLRTEKYARKKRESCDDICEYLRRHCAMKSEGFVRECDGEDAAVNLTLVQFRDSSEECEWETVHATVDVYVVHQWRKSRKSQRGHKVIKLLEGLRVMCNGKSPDGEKPASEPSFQRSQLFQGTEGLRIFYSYILFKFRVLERRSSDYATAASDLDSAKDDPRWGLYAVNYEAKFPFFRLPRNNDDHIMQPHLLAGLYEMRLEVSVQQPEGAHAEAADSLPDNLSDSASERLWVPEGEAAPAVTSVREYRKWPRLQFRLECPPERPAPAPPPANGSSSSRIQAKAARVQDVAEAREGDAASVSYRFLHGGRLVQWALSKSLQCPWCAFLRRRATPVLSLEVLLHHLQTFHCRLSFKRHPTPATSPDERPASASCMHLAVSLNHCYDGSLEIGLRSWASHQYQHQLRHHHHGDTPQRKLQFTHLLYSSLMHKINHKVRDPAIDVRPLLRGHNRLYVASGTGLGKAVADMEVDSEAEEHPAWLRHMYHKRIEEFTDVNPGEKRVMQLWNAHLLDHKCTGDYMVPSLARSFVQERGAALRGEGLRHNLLLHVANLADYGLLGQRHLVELMALFDRPPSP